MADFYETWDELVTTDEPKGCSVGDRVRIGLVRTLGSGWRRTENVDVLVEQVVDYNHPAYGDRYRGKPQGQATYFDLNAIGLFEFGPEHVLRVYPDDA